MNDTAGGGRRSQVHSEAQTGDLEVGSARQPVVLRHISQRLNLSTTSPWRHVFILHPQVAQGARSRANGPVLRLRLSLEVAVAGGPLNRLRKFICTHSPSHRRLALIHADAVAPVRFHPGRSHCSCPHVHTPCLGSVTGAQPNFVPNQTAPDTLKHRASTGRIDAFQHDTCNSVQLCN